MGRSAESSLSSSINVFEVNIEKNREHGFTSILPASSRGTKSGGVCRKGESMVIGPAKGARLADARDNKSSSRRAPTTASTKDSPEVSLKQQAVGTVDQCKLKKLSSSLAAFESTISSNRERGFTTILPDSCAGKTSRQSCRRTSSVSTKTAAGGPGRRISTLINDQEQQQRDKYSMDKSCPDFEFEGFPDEDDGLNPIDESEMPKHAQKPVRKSAGRIATRRSRIQNSRTSTKGCLDESAHSQYSQTPTVSTIDDDYSESNTTYSS